MQRLRGWDTINQTAFGITERNKWCTLLFWPLRWQCGGAEAQKWQTAATRHKEWTVMPLNSSSSISNIMVVWREYRRQIKSYLWCKSWQYWLKHIASFALMCSWGKLHATLCKLAKVRAKKQCKYCTGAVATTAVHLHTFSYEELINMLVNVHFFSFKHQYFLYFFKFILFCMRTPAFFKCYNKMRKSVSAYVTPCDSCSMSGSRIYVVTEHAQWDKNHWEDIFCLLALSLKSWPSVTRLLLPQPSIQEMNACTSFLFISMTVCLLRHFIQQQACRKCGGRVCVRSHWCQIWVTLKW